MICVTTGEERGRTTITVDGCLSAEDARVLEACCLQALTRGAPVDLFLRDVAAVDPSGREMLCRMASRGVHLLASGVYTSYLVRELSKR
ncbi:MAG: hypothetical protein ACM336_02305 [Acidobacteriota bacterium]